MLSFPASKQPDTVTISRVSRSSIKTGHSRNYGTVGGFLAMTMAENASLQRGVVMCREYPQTHSAGMHFGERTTDCANRKVISGEQRGIETGKDFYQGMKDQP